jgi:hypothetical protein
VIPGVLSAGDITSMQLAIGETLDRVAGSMRAPLSSSYPDEPFEDRLDSIARHDRAYALALFRAVLRAVLADAHRDPRIDAVAHHPRLTPMLAEILSPMNRTGHVIRPRAVAPAFSTARHRWHQDVAHPADEGCGSVRLACWMPLSDVDEYTGSLELIPGAWHNPLPHLSDSDRRLFIADERFVPHRSLPVMENSRTRWAIAMWVRAAYPAPQL